MVFFDIGAHIGFYSMMAAKLHKTIKIFSFEPIPHTFELLSNNILINDLNNIYPFNIGLLDKNNKVNFYLNPTMSGNASAQNIAEIKDIEQVSVNVTLLDDFFYKDKINKLLEFFTMNEETVTTNFFFLHRNKHQKQIQRLLVN